jgi:hypothetical protein
VVLRIWRHEKLEGYRDSIGKELIKRLKYYPFVLIIQRTFPSVNRLEQFIIEEEIFWLVMLHLISMG